MERRKRGSRGNLKIVPFPEFQFRNRNRPKTQSSPFTVLLKVYYGEQITLLSPSLPFSTGPCVKSLLKHLSSITYFVSGQLCYLQERGRNQFIPGYHKGLNIRKDRKTEKRKQKVLCTQQAFDDYQQEEDIKGKEKKGIKNSCKAHGTQSLK